MLQFGKRVIFDHKLSNSDILESHLAQIHDNLADKRSMRANREKEERSAMEKLNIFMESENQLKKNQKECQTRDIHDTNDQLKANNNHRRNWELENYKRDKMDYFPFVSGQVIEDHQKLLNNQLRTDMKAYI